VPNVRDLDLGRIIHAEFTTSSGKQSAGPHYAVVLNTKEEIEANGSLEVAVISGNNELAKPEDLVDVPKRLLPNRRKQCWVVCSWLQQKSIHDDFEVCERKAYGPFLLDIVAKVRIVKERIKKPTRS
jgi:hypothetical protein